ncbi:N-acetylmuramoyl-L-alanine amidase [Aneurinibacillus migulanus]|nr:N-acetylmuramoyl-L-alanine amidase [Aneurinibacillus migulanus]
MSAFLFVWTSATYVYAAVQVTTGTVNVTTSLALRAKPDVKSTALAWMKKGESVEVISKQGEWYQVKYKTKPGYAKASYIKIKANQEPTIQPTPKPLPALEEAEKEPIQKEELPIEENIFKVVIDAGHGGKDNGATGTIGNKEKDLTLMIAERVESKLKNNPSYDVTMTRTHELDEELIKKKVKQEPKEKANIANDKRADIFVSIHINSVTSSPSANGTETLYNGTQQDKKLAEVMHKHFVKATGFKNRGVKIRPNLVVLRDTKMPAVLLEVGFMSNHNENMTMLNPEFQERVAQGIVDGINEYFNMANPTFNQEVGFIFCCYAFFYKETFNVS